MSGRSFPPLVFLDLDDVMALCKRWGARDAHAAVNDRHPDPTAVYRELFSYGAREALSQVCHLMNGDLRFVISSTWRQLFTRVELDSVFRQSGLEFVADRLHEKQWKTSAAIRQGRRVDEIAQWLDQHHQGEPFVIIDDASSGLSLTPALDSTWHPFRGRVVLCEIDIGLLPEHVAPIVDALRRPLTLPGDLK